MLIAHILQLPCCLLACHSSRQKLPHSFCWWKQHFLYMSRRRTCMERCSHLNQSFGLAQISCLFWKCSLWAKRTKTSVERNRNANLSQRLSLVASSLSFLLFSPHFLQLGLLLYLLSLTGRRQLSPQLLHCTCTDCLSCLLQFFAQISFACLLVQYTSK